MRKPKRVFERRKNTYFVDANVLIDDEIIRYSGLVRTTSPEQYIKVLDDLNEHYSTLNDNNVYVKGILNNVGKPIYGKIITVLDLPVGSDSVVKIYGNYKTILIENRDSTLSLKVEPVMIYPVYSRGMNYTLKQNQRLKVMTHDRYNAVYLKLTDAVRISLWVFKHYDTELVYTSEQRFNQIEAPIKRNVLVLP